eukprot:TRINITY_DN18801_c0_g1_i1.p1 TRINITY_DN18801_c0_g1~~TRINITY_DN18801_c0_g1_i1.p1  ORF type:complete len:190 (-),score=44.98 TRINITY_DN18801_c0_g1_i1:313-882(-)
MGETEKTVDSSPLPVGPQPGVKYPIKVEYCGNCSMPFEFCDYYPDIEGCKDWLAKNLPDQFERLGVAGSGGTEGDGADADEKKRQKRGGKGMMKAKKKEADVERKIILSIAPRGKKKAVTVVQGMKTFGIDLKVASKFFSSKFACSSSVTGDDEIVIQGDVKDDLFDILPEKWPEIDEDLIDDIGEKKR